MEFLPNVKYKAECIRTCDGYMASASSLGCCSHFFTEGEQYELELNCAPYINSYGEIVIDFSATVLTGTVDGYDMPCGVEFYNAGGFNQYFKVVEVEVE